MGSYTSLLNESPEDFLRYLSSSSPYSNPATGFDDDDDEDEVEDELDLLAAAEFGTPEWSQLIGLIPKPASRPLGAGYKHEKQDPKHRMGDLLEECFAVYKQQHPGDPSGTHFYRWLDAMPDWDRTMMIVNHGLVRDPAKRGPAGSVPNPNVDARSNVKPSMVKAFMKGVAYLDKAGRKRRRVTFRGGTAFGIDDKGAEVALDTGQMQTVFSGKGFAIWVMSEKGKLYVGNHVKGLIHHSSFLAGANVMCGGEMKAHMGKIQLLSGKSGHYHPGIEHLVWSLNVLETCVDNFDSVKVLVWKYGTAHLVSPRDVILSPNSYSSWGNLTPDQKGRLQRGDFASFPG